MARARGFDIQTPVLAAGLAAAGAIGAVLGAAHLARPDDFAARLAVVEQKMARVRELGAGAGRPDTFPADAACAQTARGAEDVRRQIAGLASQLNLEVSQLDVAPTPPAGSSRLAPLQLRFEVDGPYAGAVDLVRRLETVRPMVFVDTVDLTSKTSSVTLAVSGRAFCSAPQ
jgi:hypothetical protein